LFGFSEIVIIISPYNDLSNDFNMTQEKTIEPAKQLSPLALELIASRFKALSEPVRLRLLNVLMQGERSVGELVEATGSGQANVSKHLAQLRDTGMIGMRKEGLSTICYIADPIVNELCEMMCRRLREEMERKASALTFEPH
jgi:DNA-binding transcriptional ArsR family regulator